ncbi:MAG: LicD family protein [Hyphomicrobiales bacterium]
MLERARYLATRKALHFCMHRGIAEPSRRLSRAVVGQLAASPALIRSLKGTIKKRGVPATDELAEALRDCMTFTERLGIRPFIVFGTLLGAIRDGRFIPGDGDIDMGALEPGALDALDRALRNSPVFRAGKSRVHAGTPSKVELIHANGVRIDVKQFRTASDGTRWVSFCSGMPLERLFPKPIGLVQQAIAGIETWRPDEAEAMLEFQYGNWRVPDRNYHWITSGPIQSEAHREWMLACVGDAFANTIGLGNLAKARSMAQSMARLFPGDPVWPALERAIADASVG